MDAARSLQDARPAQLKFFEAQNSENLRRTWAIAIASKAEMVHIPTWNDYAEGSQINPSDKMGWAPLDINSYYLTWYKTGEAPRIVRDAVYVSNRLHLSNVAVPYPGTMKIASNVVRDDAEALVFLTAPATVTVTSGTRSATCQAPAGVSTCRVALATGAVTASVVRGGVRVAAVASAVKVTASPTVQDMDYVYTAVCGAAALPRDRVPTAPKSGPRTSEQSGIRTTGVLMVTTCKTYGSGPERSCAEHRDPCENRLPLQVALSTGGHSVKLRQLVTAALAVLLAPMIRRFRRRPILLVGGHEGELFADNGRAMYKYLCAQQPAYDVYWVINADSPHWGAVASPVRRGSLRAYVYFLLAEGGFYTHTASDLAPVLHRLVRPRMVRVHLEHGVVGLKAVKLRGTHHTGYLDPTRTCGRASLSSSAM